MKNEKLRAMVCIAVVSLAVVASGCGGGGGGNSGGSSVSTGGSSTVKVGTFKFTVANGSSTATYTSSDLNGVAGFTPTSGEEQIILSEGDVLAGTDHSIYISVAPAVGTYSLGSGSNSTVAYTTQSGPVYTSAQLASPGSLIITQVSNSSITGSFNSAVTNGTTTLTVSGTFSAALNGASLETAAATRFRSVPVHDLTVKPAN